MDEDRRLIASRQTQLMPDRRMWKWDTAIIGVGGIGSNAAHLLASVGVQNITLIDPDEVGEENIWPGLFSNLSAGESKVGAVSEYLYEAFPDVAVASYPTDFITAIEDMPPTRMFDLLIVSTDDLSSRQTAWQVGWGYTRKYYIDARMGGELATVYTIDMSNEEHVEAYQKVLDEGKEGMLNCGEKATAPLTKGFIPGMIGNSLYQISNGRQPFFYQRYSLALNRLSVSREPIQ